MSKDEERLGLFFSQQHVGTLEEPTTIMDKFGSILVWHLPDVMTQLRVVRVVSL
jgi:hypothetical protein